MATTVWYGSIARLTPQHLGEGTFREFLWQNIDPLSKYQVSLLAYLLAYMARVICQNQNMVILEKKFDFLNVICKAERMWREFLSSGDGPTIKETRTKKLHNWDKQEREKCKMNCNVAIGPDEKI